MWNWQKKDWPNFSYDSEKLAPYEAEFLKNSGKSLGALEHVSEEDKEHLKIEILGEEALKTSKIEGEILDQESIQSSIRRQFGLVSDNRSVAPAERGIATMMVDLYKHFNKPLTHACLFSWHTKIMLGRWDLKSIGEYRHYNEPMQVVSGPVHQPIIHFEAPPATHIHLEMERFLHWFNESSPEKIRTINAIARAGIAHLYFVCIHPFEDGNGRIGRAISEKAMAQSLGHPTLISLAYTIERAKKEYYSALASNNKINEITDWLIYFAKTVIEAQNNTHKRIEFIIEKTAFYDRLRDQLNPRQEKVLQRMFKEGIIGFNGGLSAKNYIAITGAPRTTTTRDLQDLVSKGALVKLGALRHARYYLNIKSQISA